MKASEKESFNEFSFHSVNFDLETKSFSKIIEAWNISSLFYQFLTPAFKGSSLWSISLIVFSIETSDSWKRSGPRLTFLKIMQRDHMVSNKT